MTEKMTLSVPEAAEELGICTKMCYELTHRADFPAVKLGRRTRIPRAGLLAWIQEQQQNKEGRA